MGLLDFIKTADPRKVQAAEVQKKDDQVKLLESTSHCFMPLVTPVAGGSSSAAAPEASAPEVSAPEVSAPEVSAPEVSAPEVSAPAEMEPENVVPEDTYLDLTGPDELRKDHTSFATGTGGKTLAGLRQLMPISPLVSRPSFQADTQAHVVQSARITDVPVYTAAATVTSARENVGNTPTSDIAESSQLETSEGSNSAEAKRWHVPRWNLTNDSLLDDGFSCRTLFNVEAARQIYLESEVRSRAEHELELKEKLKVKYDARGRLLEEKDLEILRLKSLLVEEAEKAERVETTEDTNISLLDSRATYLKSALDGSKAACAEAGSLITSLTFERDKLTSEVSTLHTAFQDFKEKAEAQQEKQAQAYNPEAARTSYFDAMRALEDVDFPLVNLLKSKKDAGMDELSVPIHHSDDKAIVGETSLSFALLNVHSRTEGAKKHVAALCQLMMEIVSNPLSSQTWVGETSTSAAPLSVEDFDEEDTDEALGIVVAIPKFEVCRF
ncbi:hypothetical protein Tco_0833030, partial [Tanacetum coccineum]